MGGDRSAGRNTNEGHNGWPYEQGSEQVMAMTDALFEKLEQVRECLDRANESLGCGDVSSGMWTLAEWMNICPQCAEKENLTASQRVRTTRAFVRRDNDEISFGSATVDEGSGSTVEVVCGECSTRWSTDAPIELDVAFDKPVDISEQVSA